MTVFAVPRSIAMSPTGRKAASPQRRPERRAIRIAQQIAPLAGVTPRVEGGARVRADAGGRPVELRLELLAGEREPVLAGGLRELLRDPGCPAACGRSASRVVSRGGRAKDRPRRRSPR